MKQVFSTTAEVCAIWAAQSQDHARTGSNTSFRGETLMSYGTPIARIVKASAGSKTTVALVNSRTWSSGTSKVQGEARSAAKDAGLTVFTVPNMVGDTPAIVANLAYFSERITEALNAIERARDPSHWRAEAKARIATADAFARTFGTRPFEWAGPNPDTVLSKKEREA